VRGTVQRPTFDPATATRTFRVAMSDIGERLFVGQLMEYAAEHAPGVVVEAVAPSASLQDELAGGQVDLAVGYFGALSKQLHQRRLFKERFIYIARQGHPQVRGKLRREQLRDLPHVVAGPSGMRHADAVEKVLASPRVKAHVALRVHSFLAVGPAVARTNLIAPVPSNLAAVVAGHIDLQLLEPPIQFPGFDVTMAWHQRYHRDPASEWLRGVFVELFDSLRVPPPGGR
jgi:DNA-binding transcriptional LysR family regulator